MPTGYTSKIYEGKENVTGKSFIMDCARGFGACISMRDESSDTPIPEEFKHKESLMNSKVSQIKI